MSGARYEDDGRWINKVEENLWKERPDEDEKEK